MYHFVLYAFKYLLFFLKSTLCVDYNFVIFLIEICIYFLVQNNITYGDEIMNNTVGEKLYQLRRENGYTQEQVSRYLGITQSNLSKIENGERNFNMNLLDKLCLLYNCSPEYLLGEEDFHEKSSIAFRSDEKVDLNVVAKMNEITGYLKLLRKLDGDK